ncbi:MAG TPA: DMT family transporter [Candidatus Limnocylindrales bacterium]|jgi:drug/metabolite transporter (DMT)-like permease
MAGKPGTGAFSLAVVAGAMCLAFSGILVVFAAVSPSTAATYRALLAIPPLIVLAWWEERRQGPRTRRQRGFAFAAGVFFALDLTFFHHTIPLLGAGLATVMGNLQVIFVGVIAWLVLGERPSNRLLAGVPVALVGVLLISGVLDAGAYGSNPVLGAVFGLATAASYAGYLLVLRRGQDGRHVAGPILDATISTAIFAAIGGIIVGDLEPVPGWQALAWLLVLAVSAQVAGGLLVAAALPRLPAVTTSLLLLSQPVASIVLAMLIVDEAPSISQLAGVALVVAGVALGTLPFGRMAAGARRSTA